VQRQKTTNHGHTWYAAFIVICMLHSMSAHARTAAEDENGFRPISLRPTASSPAWASLKLFDGFPDDATTQKVSGSLMKVILFGATAWWDREYSSNAWTAPQWKASWPSDGAPRDAGTPNSPK